MARVAISSKKKKRIISILLEKQDNKCCYCQCDVIEFNCEGVDYNKIPANMATIEHLRRIEDGGTNRNDNLAIACLGCNRGRGSVDWLTYKSYRMGEIIL